MKGKLTNERTKPVTRTSRDYLVAIIETPLGTMDLTVWADGRYYLTEDVGEGEKRLVVGVIGLGNASSL